MDWYRFFDAVADSVNPLLALTAIFFAVREWRSSPRGALLFAAATALGLAGIYAVQALDNHSAIWRRWGGDYSTHAAFATSVVASLIAWWRRRRLLLIAVLAAYLVLVILMGYHRIVDVATASAVAVLVTAAWQIAAIRLARSEPRPARTSPPG